MGHSVGFKIKGRESIGSAPGGFCSIIVATVVFSYAVLVYSTVLFHLAFATEVTPDYMSWQDQLTDPDYEKEPTTFETATGASYGIQIFDYSGRLNSTELENYLRVKYYYVDNNNLMLAATEFEEEEQDDDSEEEEI